MTKFFKQTIKDVPLDNQTVLVRADYNVPLNDSGKISDDLRIKASLPTLKYLLNRGCRVVIMSHLGRPEGRDSKLSLELVATRLAELLDQKVEFCSQVYGDQVSQAVKQLPKSSVLMLENIRFYPEEEANDSDFAAKIAASTKARYFVQDGFGVVHRAHASTSAITWHIPGVAGLLLEREYQTITAAVSKPERPLVAVLGGAKVGDKIAVIERFVEVADKILIGGAMANTFLNYRGFKTGSSKLETNQTETLDKISRAAKTNDCICHDRPAPPTLPPRAHNTKNHVTSMRPPGDPPAGANPAALDAPHVAFFGDSAAAAAACTQFLPDNSQRLRRLADGPRCSTFSPCSFSPTWVVSTAAPAQASMCCVRSARTPVAALT
jgi:3-phosphoglycerate kinase